MKAPSLAGTIVAFSAVAAAAQTPARQGRNALAGGLRYVVLERD